MSGLIKFSDVRDKVVRLRDQDVLLDFSVAELYGVETRIVNQAQKIGNRYNFLTFAKSKTNSYVCCTSK